MKHLRRLVAFMVLCAVAALVYLPLVTGQRPAPSPVLTNLRGHPITPVPIPHHHPRP